MHVFTFSTEKTADNHLFEGQDPESATGMGDISV